MSEGGVDCGKRKNYVVLKTVNEFGEIGGKKALQKILYFTNLETRIFPYQWNTYGPYSEEVKYQLDDMVLDGQINLEEVELMTKGRTKFNMKLTESGQSYLESIGEIPGIDSRIKFVHQFLNGKSSREMELLASVHYIALYKNGKFFDKIFDIISELKPKAGFIESDVDNAIKELQAHKLLIIN